MELIDKLLNLASDLDDYLKGTIQDDIILRTYFSDTDKDIKTITANLGQFFDDTDIREKDDTYRAMQENEMKKLIHLLRLGQLDQAKKINFLYESEIEYQ